MPLDIYLAFVAASALLILTPGPMVAYVVGTTLSRGLSHGFIAVAGSLLASMIHLSIVALGLTALMSMMSEAFFSLKWIGAAYLFYLGARAWSRPPGGLDSDAPTSRASRRRTFTEAFFVNLANPKGLLFHGAFLPLFISPSTPPGPQLALLATTFLVIACAIDSCWALFASRLKPLLLRIGRWRHRITGGVLMTAAAGLALARKG